MFSSNNKISVRQLQSLLILYFLGVTAVYLPGIAVGQAGQDGWVSVLIAAGLAVIGCYLMLSAVFTVPGDSFHDIACNALSRPLGKLVCVALLAKITLDAALKLRIFGGIIRAYLLPLTPFWLVGLVTLALGGLTAYHGFETKGRVAEILVFVVMIPLILLMLAGVRGADFTNLLPAFGTSAENFLAGGLESGYAFSGLALLLVAAPFLGSYSTKARRRIVGTVGFMGILLFALTVLVIAKIGTNSALNTERPLLEFLFTIDIPGAFMQRQTAIMVSFWIFTTFIMAALALFFGSVLIKGVVGAGSRRVYALLLIPVIFVLSLIPQSSTAALEYSRMLFGYTEYAFVLLLPFVIVVISRIRRLGQ